MEIYTIEQQMEDTAVEAFEYIMNGEGKLLIKLPKGVTLRGSTWASSFDVIESVRLGTWTTEVDGE